jgi:hypothetical protein
MSLSTPRITIQLSATHVARNWEAAVERRRVCNLLGDRRGKPPGRSLRPGHHRT